MASGALAASVAYAATAQRGRAVTRLAQSLARHPGSWRLEPFAPPETLTVARRRCERGA